jgi:hypothetical protein
MLSLPGLLRRSVLVAALLFSGSALSTPARADADLDLLRDIAAQPSPGPSPAASARRARSLPPRARRTGPPARAARPVTTAPRLRLTAQQRGSGRVDVLELSADAPAGGALPAIARKNATVAPALLAVRRR